MARTTAFAILIGTILIAPAAAQFGSIFGEPPRPPGGVPGGQSQGNAPPQGNPPQGNYPPQGDYPPTANYPPARNTQVPGSRQHPAAATAAADRRCGHHRSRPARTRQRSSASAPPQPADTSPQPGDEVIAEPPSQKITNPAALFSGLDKITGRIINFDVAIGETVQFGALQVTPRACYTRPPTETPNTDGFVEVDEVTLQGEVRRIFTGWMFASSPGLHAVEHPIYDLWLTDCKGPVVTAEQQPAAETPPAPTPARAQPKQQQQPKRQQPTVQRQQPQQQPSYPPFR